MIWWFLSLYLRNLNLDLIDKIDHGTNDETKAIQVSHNRCNYGYHRTARPANRQTGTVCIISASRTEDVVKSGI